MFKKLMNVKYGNIVALHYVTFIHGEERDILVE